MASIVTVPEAAAARSALASKSRAFPDSRLTSTPGAKRLRIASNCSRPCPLAAAVEKRTPGRRSLSHAAARAIGGPMRPNFRTARTRQQGHEQVVLAGGRRRSAPFRSLLIGNRMTDEYRFHAFFAQQGRFKRKQAQHPVAIAADAPCPAGAPGPYRGAYVLHGAHATPLQAPGQAQVEFRRIHAHKNVRAKLGELPEQPAAKHPQARQVADDFGQAHDREFRRIEHGPAPRLAHCGARNAGHLHLHRPGAQGANQSRAQAIAGGLAGDHRYPQGPVSRRQRKRPRPDSARNSVIGVNSGCSRAASAMISVASARLSSLR